MKKIQFGKRIINIPTEFSELSTKQIIRWADLASAQLTHTQFNVLMLLNIISDRRMQWFFFKNEYLIPFLDKVTLGYFSWKVKIIDEEQFHELSIISEGFHNQEDMPLDNPLPILNFSLHCYQFFWTINPFTFEDLYGHNLLFNNLTFRQYRKCEEYFAKYLETFEEKHLDYLIAWLYVPKYLEKRISLSEVFTEKRAKQNELLQKAVKKTIFTNYYVNRKAIIPLYAFLYTQGGKKVAKIKEIHPYAVKFNYEKSLRAIAGHVNAEEETDLQPAHSVLAYLNDAAEEADKIKKLTPTQS